MQPKRLALLTAAQTSTGDKLILTPSAPVSIIKWGFIVTTTLSSSGAVVFTGDFRPTAGSDTARVTGAVTAGIDTAGGQLSTGLTTAGGKGFYHKLSQPLELVAGQEFIIKLATAATSAGSGVLWVEYLEGPFTGVDGAGFFLNLTNAAS